MAKIKNPLTIVNLSSSDNDLAKYCKSFTITYSADITQDLSLEFGPYLMSLFQALRDIHVAKPNMIITIKTENSSPASMYQMFRSARAVGNGSVKELKIINTDLSKITTYDTMFYQTSTDAIPEIFNFEFDFSSVTNSTNASWSTGSSRITTVRYKSNTLSVSQNCRNFTNLTNESLVSMCNGIKDGVTGQALTFRTTQQARFESIMGTVTTVDGVNTFTLDESGTVSLSNFVTNYKGWSLAYA